MDEGFFIIATLGPRTLEDERTYADLVEAGADHIRVNMSHTSHEEAAEIIRDIREQTPEARILFDLEGAKLRVGALSRSLEVEDGQNVVFTSESVYEQLREKAEAQRQPIVPVRAPFPFSRFADATVVRMKDAMMSFRVLENRAAREGWLACQAERGGVIRAEKGINVPGVDRSDSGLTEKDRADLVAAATLRPDAICVSFVTDASELADVRAILADEAPGWTPELWAKVECLEAFDHLDAICAAADVVLVGRGDLAGEGGLERVDDLTLQAILTAVDAGVPCAVGTDLLESMRRRAVPDSDEVKEIAKLVAAGVRGFLLTAETSVGRHPLEAIAALGKLVLMLG